MAKENQAGTLYYDIKSFAESLPDWSKYLANKLLSSSTLEDYDYGTVYKYFKEDCGLKSKEERPEIKIEISESEGLAYKSDLILMEIKNIEGVNALAEGQHIELSPSVTVIYGANGSGKTGYIRLLNNAFFSRSNDKEIVPNIKLDNGHKLPACEFIFRSEGSDYTLRYPDDQGKIEFQQFAVFDCKSVLVHLNEKKEFVFRPRALDFFADLIFAFEKVKEKLNAEITEKNTPKDFSVLFDGDSVIKMLIDNLSTQTNIGELKEHIPFTDQDKENRKKQEQKKTELNAIKEDKDKRIKKLENIKELIGNLKTDIENNNQFFTASKLKELQTAIWDYNEKQKTAQQEGIENFKTDNLKNIGSPEWKAFIEAAEAFALKQEKEKYPEQGNRCLLCQQFLNEKEVQLIESYWSFIKSKVEEDAKKAKELLDRLKNQYQQINFNLLPENNVLTEWFKENYPDTLKSLKSALENQKVLSQSLNSDLEKQMITEKQENKIDTIVLISIETTLSEKIKELKEKNIDEELKKINTSITYLTQKEKLDTHIDDIEQYVNRLKWVANAEVKKRKFNPISITEEGKRRSKKYFGQAYSDKFNEECDSLNAHFDIELLHSGSYGSSYREFRIKGRLPSQILSEGEQRAISLADFLAEIQLSGINRGIVFDEPVTSLDEERKSIIAKRLVKEAQYRQVIIFTHDLVFLSSIIGHCEELKVNFECHWIEKVNGQPGTIWLRNTPSYEKSYKNSGKAQEFYDKALRCPPEEREINIKNGFAALRTSYEALVIFNLFEGVVQRFNERVSVDSLSSVYFDEVIRDEILDGFYKCCQYMEGHSHSDKYSYKKAKINNLKEEIERFNTIKKKLRDKKKTKS